MKSMIKKLVKWYVQSDSLWSMLDATMIRTFEYAKVMRHQTEAARNHIDIHPTIGQEFIANMSDLTVKNGPFQGMRYPGGEAVGSSITPKIIGSYERELHYVIEDICTKDYSAIVNIGCGEGYYAVGLAMRVEQAMIFAFDIDERAIRLCGKMAQINDVGERLLIGSFCSAVTLKNIPLGKKALIISDCEGYEKELFNADSFSNLIYHDLLIELHDWHGSDISSNIRSLFQDTHVIKSIYSIDDLEKAKTYQYKELESYDLDARCQLLREGRPQIMEWFYMTSKVT